MTLYFSFSFNFWFVFGMSIRCDFNGRFEFLIAFDVGVLDKEFISDIAVEAAANLGSQLIGGLNFNTSIFRCHKFIKFQKSHKSHEKKNHASKLKHLSELRNLLRRILGTISYLNF